MASHPPSLGRFQVLTLLFVTLIQLPAVLWACALTHSPLPALGAVGVSLPYLRHLRTPWHSTSPARVAYLTLGWWSACLVFGVLLLPAALAIHAGLPRAWV